MRWRGYLTRAVVVGALVSIVAAGASSPVGAVEPTTFVVNSTGDAADAALGNGVCATSTGVCTLRAALGEAKEGPNNFPVRIHFGISGPGVRVIDVGSILPEIVVDDPPITIDGYTQPGARPNTDPLISNAAIRIHLRGTTESSGNPLMRISGSDNVIRGLAMTRAFNKIHLRGAGCTNNVIAGNFIGTDPTGTYGASTRTTYANGIQITGGCHHNWIGLPTMEGRNVVSGNAGHGIALYYLGTNENLVMNNIVGLSPAGTSQIPNRVEGIDVNRDASYNVVGGFGPLEGNLVSGNLTGGIEVSHVDNATVGNQILGNRVGTDPTGTRAFAYTANVNNGIIVEDGASYTIVDRNVVGNSTGSGRNIRVRGWNPVVGTIIRHNRIGIGLDGQLLGGAVGIGLNSVLNQYTRIENNIITGHSERGIEVDCQDSNDFNTFTRNSIWANTGLGIDLCNANVWGVNQNDPGDADTGANDKLNFPVVTSADTATVSGTVCASCTVEVFIADGAVGGYGSGRTFVASGVANGSGAFTIPVGSLVTAGAVLTTTATDPAGNTSEFSRNVAVVEAPNVAPTAAFSVSCAGLTCTFNGASSSDVDGSVVSWAWNLGDGTMATGPLASHTFAAGGTGTVTLTVIDDDGATGATSQPIAVVAPAATPLAADSFERQSTGGFGTADMGGGWVHWGSEAPNMSVTGGGGWIRIAAGTMNQGWLPSVSGRDVDAAVTVSTDRVPTASGGQTAVLTIRRQGPNIEYRGRLTFSANGQVRASIVAAIGTSATVLGPSVLVPDVVYAPGTLIRMRIVATGINPTTLRLRVWAAGQPEPLGWHVIRTDATAQLQAAGGTGVQASANSATTNGPVGFGFDDLAVTAAGTRPG